MRVKIEKVIEGTYGYDSVIVEINKVKTDIVFEKQDKVKQYEGKLIELINEDGIYKIKEPKTVKEVKNSD